MIVVNNYNDGDKKTLICINNKSTDDNNVI